MTERFSHSDLAALFESRLDKIHARLDEEAKERAAFREQSVTTNRAFVSTLQLQAEQLQRLEDKLGAEPDSDGRHGKGLIGDVRKQSRDMQSLMDLRAKGVGAIAAIGLFGALIILGIIHWVEGIRTGGAA